MATVVDLSGNGGPVDYSLVKHNRINAGNPNASVTPLFSGEIILDSTNDMYWQAMGITNNEWIPYSPVTQDVVA